MAYKQRKKPRNQQLIKRVMPGNGPLIDRVIFNKHKLGQMMKTIKNSPEQDSVQVRFFLNEL